MAISSLASLEKSLKRAFSDEYVTAVLNLNAGFWQHVLGQAKNIRQEGEGYYFPFYMQTPQNVGTPAEGGNVPEFKTREEIQGRVRTGQFIGGFEISFVLEAVGSARGSWNNGEVKRHAKESIDDLTKHVNRMLAGQEMGSGGISGLLATVESTADTTHFVPAFPQGTLLLRPKQKIGVWIPASTERVGSPVTITKIVQSTRVITVSGAVTAMAAADEIYIDGSRASAMNPNSVLHIIDDGTVSRYIHPAGDVGSGDRQTYEELKATVLTAGGLRDLSEELLVEAAHTVRQFSGQLVDCLVMNTGQFSKWLKFTRPDRRYTVTGKDIPTYSIGYKASDEYRPAAQFMHSGVACDVYVCEDITPRLVYGITKRFLQRLTTLKMQWMDHGGGSMFTQGVNSTGLKTSKAATLIHLENILSPLPAAHFQINKLYDKELCGAARGGTDT